MMVKKKNVHTHTHPHFPIHMHIPTLTQECFQVQNILVLKDSLRSFFFHIRVAALTMGKNGRNAQNGTQLMTLNNYSEEDDDDDDDDNSGNDDNDAEDEDILSLSI